MADKGSPCTLVQLHAASCYMLLADYFCLDEPSASHKGDSHSYSTATPGSDDSTALHSLRRQLASGAFPSAPPPAPAANCALRRLQHRTSASVHGTCFREPSEARRPESSSYVAKHQLLGTNVNSPPPRRCFFNYEKVHQHSQQTARSPKETPLFWSHRTASALYIGTLGRGVTRTTI